jgi:hypothetical protein
MLAILHLLVMFVADIFKSRRRVEAENLFQRAARPANGMRTITSWPTVLSSVA